MILPIVLLVLAAACVAICVAICVVLPRVGLAVYAFLFYLTLRLVDTLKRRITGRGLDVLDKWH